MVDMSTEICAFVGLGVTLLSSVLYIGRMVGTIGTKLDRVIEDMRGMNDSFRRHVQDDAHLTERVARIEVKTEQ